MILQLITLSGVKVDQEVYEVIIPTPDGEIAVFPDHEPLVTVVSSGAIVIRDSKDTPSDDMEYIAVSGGVAEIAGKSIKLLVDEADGAGEIVQAEVEAALKRAIEMRDNAKDQVELEKAQALVDRHAVRLKVADLHRRRRRH